MKIQCSYKDAAKDRVFSLRITREEEEQLRLAAQSSRKSMAALIRAGHLHQL